MTLSPYANTVVMWDEKPILLDRFLARLPQRPDLEECWIWPQSAYPGRYGDYGRFKRQSHRVMFFVAHGHLPDGGDVRHLCHNGRCVNPLHLAEGTRSENMMDSAFDGRLRHVVDGEMIEAVRGMRARGASQQSIADAVGIDQTTVSRVLAGWRDHYTGA